MDQDQINYLANTIARAMGPGSLSDLKAVKESIDRINTRLDKLESAAFKSAAQHPIPITHPSQDRFAVAEAIADSIFGPEAKEKACTFEPDRPCDHCSMCSSRGF
jgi:hypothetical protein